MAGPSRQTPAVDIASLFSIIWFLIALGIFYWFYSTMKRIEQTLEEIKKLLESKQSSDER
jgi:hypothetical protein